MMRHRNKIVFLMVISSLVGCSQASARISPDHAQVQASAESPMPSQLIIKFREGAPGPLRAEMVRELSRDAGAALVYVRPLSGGAHVIRLQNSTTAVQLGEVIRRLQKRADVEYVEEDRIMRHQQR